MSDPTTEAGRLHAERHRPCPRTDEPTHTHNGECPDLIRAEIAAIEAEARAVEADRWRRLPGAYRLPDGSREVILDVPESASFVADEYPDEVTAIQAEARAPLEAEIARLRRIEEAAIRISDKRTLDSDGFWVSKREMRYLDDALRAALEGTSDVPADFGQQVIRSTATGRRVVRAALAKPQVVPVRQRFTATDAFPGALEEKP